MSVRIDHIANGAQRDAASRETRERSNARYGTQPPSARYGTQPPPPRGAAGSPLKGEDVGARRTAASSHRS